MSYMSTKCCIKVIDNKDNYTLYHTHDGYPSGVGADLMHFIYPIIQRTNLYTAVDIASMLVNASWDEEYEHVAALSPQIEYLYIIDLRTKQIRCYGGYVDRCTYYFVKNIEFDLEQYLPLKPKRCYR